MGVLRVMCSEGDRQYPWDNEQDLTAASQIFNELKQKNYLAYEVKGDGSAESIGTFRPDAKTIVMHTPLVGG